MGFKSAIWYFTCRVTFYGRKNYVQLNHILNLGFSKKWSHTTCSCLYSGESPESFCTERWARSIAALHSTNSLA